VHKKGISSYQMATELNITQTSSWFLLSRIRYAMEHENFAMNFDGTIELDETYVGGRNSNRHYDKRKHGTQGRSGEDKQPVFGMFQDEIAEIKIRPHKRNNQIEVAEKIVHKPAVVRVEVVDNVKAETLLPIIGCNVDAGSIVVTDEFPVYQTLNADYWHDVVYHRLKNYVTCDGLTTNRIEGFWNILKKVWGTTYMGRVSVKHLHRYCRETEYRFKTRHLTGSERLNLLLIGTEKRLRYVDLKNNL